MLGSKKNFFAVGKHKVTENDFYRNCGMGNYVERAAHWKRFYHCDNDYALGSIVDVGKKSSEGCRGNGVERCCGCHVEGRTLR